MVPSLERTPVFFLGTGPPVLNDVLVSPNRTSRATVEISDTRERWVPETNQNSTPYVDVEEET